MTMEINDAEISGVLKTLYANYREKVFPIITPLMANIKRAGPGGPRAMRWGGNGVNFNVVLGRPVGFTASSLGWLPNHAQAEEKQATVDIKRVYVTRQIDGLAIFGTQNKQAAYIALAQKILEEAKTAAQLGMQETLHGDGQGIKGLITVVNSTTSIDVASPYGIASSGQAGLTLDKGMYVAVLDTGSGNAVLGRATITAITHSGDTATLTLDTAIAGMAPTDKVVACTTQDTSFQSFPNGLTNILNRGGSYNDLHNLSAATYSRWNTTRLTAGTDTPDANQPSEQDIWELMTRVAGRSGFDARMKPGEFLMVTTPGIKKKLADQFFGQRQLGPSDFQNIKGGFKAITICGLPLIDDLWCPAGTIYLIHTPSLAWVSAKDFGQLQYESAGAWRFVDGRDAYQINWGEYLNVATVNRIAHGMITGYTDTNRYSFVI